MAKAQDIHVHVSASVVPGPSDITRYAEAFAEWDRRYREDPAGFESDMERIMRGQTVDDYGQVCASYFAELLGDASRRALLDALADANRRGLR